MNPSTEDILKEIERTPAEIVYVLPNNKNIIMAAEQCVSLCEDKKVVVLPTKTIPQGIAATLCAEPGGSEEDNTAAMTDGFSRVRTSEITYAARDSDFGGFAIKQGDYLALEEHQLFGTDRDLESMLDRLAHSEGLYDICGIRTKQSRPSPDMERACSVLRSGTGRSVFLLSCGRLISE